VRTLCRPDGLAGRVKAGRPCHRELRPGGCGLAHSACGGVRGPPPELLGADKARICARACTGTRVPHLHHGLHHRGREPEVCAADAAAPAGRGLRLQFPRRPHALQRVIGSIKVLLRAVTHRTHQRTHTCAQRRMGPSAHTPTKKKKKEAGNVHPHRHAPPKRQPGAVLGSAMTHASAASNAPTATAATPQCAGRGTGSTRALALAHWPTRRVGGGGVGGGVGLNTAPHPCEGSPTRVQTQQYTHTKNTRARWGPNRSSQQEEEAVP
jgi:hypothetical protein